MVGAAVNGAAVADEIRALQTHPHDGGAGRLQNFVHFFCAKNGLLPAQRGVHALPIFLIEIRLVQNDGGIQARQLRPQASGFPCGMEALLHRIAGQSDHQLNPQLEAIVLNLRNGIIDLLHRVTSAALAEYILVEGLHAQLDGIHGVFFQVIQNLRGDVVRPGGQVNLLNGTILFVLPRHFQIGPLFFQWNPCKTSAVECGFHHRNILQCGEPGADGGSHVLRADCRRACGDFPLVAEDAVVGTSFVWDKNRNNGVLLVPASQ